MANMSYCRFQNTLVDLEDAYEHFEDHISEGEDKCRQKMIKLCKKIVADYGKIPDELPILDEDGDE